MPIDEQAITWEYRVVWMEMRQVMVDDVEQNVTNIDRELNSMGAKGWELVFVRDVGGGKVGSRFAYIFKRQVGKGRDIASVSENAEASATKQHQRSPKIDWNSRF